MTKIIRAIYDSALPPHLQRFAVLMAECGKPDGTDVRPGVDHLTYWLHHTRRGVQKSLRQLEALGVLVPVGSTKGGSGQTTRYRIDIDALPRRAEWVPPKQRTQSSPFPIRNSEPQFALSDQKGVTPATQKGEPISSPDHLDHEDQDLSLKGGSERVSNRFLKKTSDQERAMRVEQVLALYHECCHSFARGIELTPQLERQIASADLDGLRQDLERAERSDFVAGRNPTAGWAGRGADLGWLLKADNRRKLRAGNYDNPQPSTSARMTSAARLRYALEERDQQEREQKPIRQLVDVCKHKPMCFGLTKHDALVETENAERRASSERALRAVNG
jgi:hypothetical protein